MENNWEMANVLSWTRRWSSVCDASRRVRNYHKAAVKAEASGIVGKMEIVNHLVHVGEYLGFRRYFSLARRTYVRKVDAHLE
jgi:hypothetical protein